MLLIKGMRGGGKSKISLSVSEVVWFSACWMFVMIKLMVVGFCSVRRCSVMLLWVMGVGFENPCTVWDKWNVSVVISRINEWGYNRLRVPLIIAEHGVVIATTSYWSRGLQIDTHWWPIFISWVSKFVFRNRGGMKFCDASWGLQYWGSKFSCCLVAVPLEWNTCLLINFDVVNFVWKTCEWEKGSIILLLLSCVGAFNVGGQGLVGWGRNTDLGPAEIASFCSWFFYKLVWLDPEVRQKCLTIQLSLAIAWLLALALALSMQ